IDTDAGFKHPTRCLSWTETRKTDFVCNLAECRIEIAIELRLVYFDGQFDFVAL
ncbi:MAG: hypothetical protein RLY19_859, partial [Actinomycetota bacterium]